MEYLEGHAFHFPGLDSLRWQWRIQTFRWGGGGGGGGHPDPEIRGGAVLKKVFSALRASVWSKSKGGAGLPRAPPLNPPLVEADPPIV